MIVPSPLLVISLLAVAALSAPAAAACPFADTNSTCDTAACTADATSDACKILVGAYCAKTKAAGATDTSCLGVNKYVAPAAAPVPPFDGPATGLSATGPRAGSTAGTGQTGTSERDVSNDPIAIVVGASWTRDPAKVVAGSVELVKVSGANPTVINSLTEDNKQTCPFKLGNGAPAPPCTDIACGPGARGSTACRTVIITYCQGNGAAAVSSVWGLGRVECRTGGAREE